MQTTLTRTVRFRAEHHYHRADWSSERNREAFGDTAVPHTHLFEVAVSVSGPVDPETGFLVDLGALDALLEREVRAPLAEQSLNEAVPSFRHGRLQPSTEALAQVLWERLDGSIPLPARLERVVVRESDSLESEVRRP
ncbi:MAG: 6-carboxytetrahydropterin synthase [Gemmatimonadota bacterium]|nr:6-carboxytetrahydropterin synthase [Gemmatimonadota bacterium]